MGGTFNGGCFIEGGAYLFFSTNFKCIFVKASHGKK